MGKIKKLEEQVRSFILANEGREIRSATLVREIKDIKCPHHACTLLSQCFRSMTNLYRVACGTYILDRSRKRKPHTKRSDKLVEKARNNGGAVTVDEIIETCLVDKAGVCVLIGEINRNKYNNSVRFVREVSYRLEEVGDDSKP